MQPKSNEYLKQGTSDTSEAESGYDSEAIEIARTQRKGAKKRKLSHSPRSRNGDVDADDAFTSAEEYVSLEESENFNADQAAVVGGLDVQNQTNDHQIKHAPIIRSKLYKKLGKGKTPGVVYLSSLPPYLKPSALRNILAQRGFEPITRLFLTPSSKHKHGSKKSSRQLYTEGWIEFANKKTAKRCAEALNAQLIGGPKGGFYYDDLWNMKYLKGMAWDELMTGIREERREEQGRRDEERRKLAQETRNFVEGVEEGKRLDGITKKRIKQNRYTTDGEAHMQRVWRQHEVAAIRMEKTTGERTESEVQDVLSKIF